MPRKRKTSARGIDEYEVGYHSLPSDLLCEELLPKLSVQSLARFKCVSKAFRDYIKNDSSLVNRHLRHHSRNSKLSVALSLQFQRLFFFDHSNKNKNKVEFTDIASSIKKLAGSKWSLHSIVGSCDGLLCLRLRPETRNCSEEIALLNPETREGRNTSVPPIPSDWIWFRKFRDFPLYGFGPDEDRNDYKVVRIVATDFARLEIDVFSRNTGQWKRAETVLYGYSFAAKSQAAVLLRGRLYWLILSSFPFHQNCVLSFDLRSEAIHLIPEEPKGHFKYANPADVYVPHRLVKWKESLAYLSFPNSRVSVIGFQMIDSDRDVSGFSWSGKSSPPGAPSNWRFCGVSRDAFFVSQRDDATLQLVMCDPFAPDYENDGHREVLSVSHHDSCWEVHDFVPSLVSVYPRREAKDRKQNKVRHWVYVFKKKIISFLV